MAAYLLIESRDPFESNIVARQYDLAVNLVKEGNQVTLFLVQNGVLPARPGTRSSLLTNAARAVVNVIGSCLATVVVAKWEGAFDTERAGLVLGNSAVPAGLSS